MNNVQIVHSKCKSWSQLLPLRPCIWEKVIFDPLSSKRNLKTILLKPNKGLCLRYYSHIKYGFDTTWVVWVNTQNDSLGVFLWLPAPARPLCFTTVSFFLKACCPSSAQWHSQNFYTLCGFSPNRKSAMLISLKVAQIWPRNLNLHTLHLQLQTMHCSSKQAATRTSDSQIMLISCNNDKQ